jgi:ecotin
VKILLSVSLFVILALGTEMALADDMKAFPPADPGSVRYVLSLPSQAREEDYEVELIVGQIAKVDSANRYFFGGNIEAQNIQGWGYTRYVVKELGPMAGTRVAVSPNAPKQNRFVTLGGDPYLIRYNSRLPVVVYVPERAEVRYRIWRADKSTKSMNPG